MFPRLKHKTKAIGDALRGSLKATLSEPSQRFWDPYIWTSSTDIPWNRGSFWRLSTDLLIVKHQVHLVINYHSTSTSTSTST